MLQVHMTTAAVSDMPYALISDGDEHLMVINVRRREQLPLYLQEYLANRLLALTRKMPPQRQAKIIDLGLRRAAALAQAVH